MIAKLCIYTDERTVSLFSLTEKEGKARFVLLLVNDEINENKITLIYFTILIKDNYQYLLL